MRTAQPSCYRRPQGTRGFAWLLVVITLTGVLTRSVTAQQTSSTAPPPTPPPAAAPTPPPTMIPNAGSMPQGTVTPQGTAVPPPSYTAPGLNGTPLVPPEPPTGVMPMPSVAPEEDMVMVSTPEPTGAWWPYWPRGEMFYRTKAYGNAVENYGFSTFIPFQSLPGSRISFVDLRYFKTFDYDGIDGAAGLNAGLAHRWYNDIFNRVFGANFYYDYRDTGLANFNQLGFGFETLGEVYDGRFNAYIPFGETRPKVSDAYVNPRFVPGAMLVDRERVFQAAMSGFDFEGGRKVPYTGEMLRAFAGGYFLFADGSSAAIGIKARLEARVTDMAGLDLTVSQDNVFGNYWTFGCRINYPGILPRNRPLVPRVVDRLGEPIVRNTNIAVDNQVFTETEQATQNGVGVVAFFIDPSNLSGQFGSEGNVLVLNNGTYYGGLILQDNQGVSGAGNNFPINTDQGYFSVPNPYSGTSTINASGFTAGITLADNNTIAGVTISGGTYGISTSSSNTNTVSGNLYSNTISGATSGGIYIDGGTGIWNINQNSVSSTSAGDGIAILLDNGSSGVYNLARNTTNSNNGNGVEIVVDNGSSLVASITSSTSSSNTNDNSGILLNAQGTSSSLVATVSSNTLQSNGSSGTNAAGLTIQAGDTASIDVTASSNTISSNAYAGVTIQNTGNSTTETPSITVDLSSNTITSNSNSASTTSGGGVWIYAAQGSPSFDLTIDSNTINSNAFNGILFEADGATGTPSFNAVVSNNILSSNGTSSGTGAGISVLGGADSGQTPTFTSLQISGNTISSSAYEGIDMTFLESGTTGTVYIQNNSISSNGYDGVNVTLGTSGSTTGAGAVINVSATSNTFSSTNSSYSSIVFTTQGTSTSTTLNLETSSNTTDALFYLVQSDTSTFNYVGDFPSSTSSSNTGIVNQVLSDNPNAESVDASIATSINSITQLP